ALGWPVRAHDLTMEAPDYAIDRFVDGGELVAPDGDDSPVDENAANFSVETRQIEPVKRLSDGDEIHRPRVEAGALRDSNAIGDPRVFPGLGELLFRRVGRDHPLEAAGELLCRLTAPGRAVPCERRARRERREPVENRGRIARSKARVILRSR